MEAQSLAPQMRTHVYRGRYLARGDPPTRNIAMIGCFHRAEICWRMQLRLRLTKITSGSRLLQLLNKLFPGCLGQIFSAKSQTLN